MSIHPVAIDRILSATALASLLTLASCVTNQPTDHPADIAATEIPAEVYRQFDFWIGEWAVTDAAGRAVGASRVELAENGFAIIEYWTSARGGTGRSINYVDPADGQWKQNWVSSRGNVVNYSGRFESGAMRFEGRSTVADGTTELARAVFTPRPDGAVHQFIEHSRDAGATWYAYFDGTYRKRPLPEQAVGEEPQR